MVPLAKHVTSHKQMLEQHMETLYKINESKENLASKTSELRGQHKALELQLETLDKMYQQIHNADNSSPPAVKQAASG